MPVYPLGTRGLAVALAAIGAAPHSANAQEAATGAEGIQYFVAPYLWLAGVYATTQTPLARAQGQFERRPV
jgi:hypothetical protein